MTRQQAQKFGNQYSGVRVTIFGASGFIGRWVARTLESANAQLYLIVRNKERARKVFSQFDVSGTIVEADLLQLELVDSLLRDIRPSIVFNLAGYGIRRLERDEELAYQMNSDLVRAICTTMAGMRDENWKGQEIIQAGSVTEYGTVIDSLSEESSTQPDTLYGKSKLRGTQLLTQCCKSSGVSGLTVRIFSVYGPGEQSGRLLPSLLELVDTEDSLPLSHGAQKRDFSYVEDVAEGLVRLGLSHYKPGGVVNLASGKLISVKDFVLTAANIFSIPNEKLLFGALSSREKEIQHGPVTLGRLRQLIGWIPGTSVKLGIKKTLDFFEG